jgi:hypothetical protein
MKDMKTEIFSGFFEMFNAIMNAPGGPSGAIMNAPGGASGASPIRQHPAERQRMNADEVAQLESQIYDVLLEDRPQSVRHVFYRMTNPRLPLYVEKSDQGYKQVQNRCSVMRREGTIPYGWFADMSRRGYFTNTYTSATDFIRKKQSQYRADLWQDSDWRCEVWCESRSVASVLLADCTDLAVSLYPCGGFTSMTFAHEAAEQHNDSDDDRPLKVFYVGDYDPAGVLIDVSLERELREHLEDVELDFERIAINPEQITEYDLPTKPRKASEKRKPEVELTVEAEAMPAQLMREILRTKVEALLPANALEVAKVAEASERQHLIRMAEILQGGTA